MRHPIHTSFCAGLAVALLTIFVVAGQAAHAAEVRVYAAGAAQKGVQALAADFEAKTGHKIVATYDTVGALRDKVLGGEAPHIIILSSAGLKALEDKGRLKANSRVDLGRTGVGLMGLPGAANSGVQDISTPEKLKATLLAAKSIAHADPARGATAGTHFRKIIGELGIADQLKDRIIVVPFGGAIAEQVAAGVFEIGVSQATEIVPNTKVRFLGFLPDALQLWTVYGAGVVDGGEPAAAEFLGLLSSPVGQAAFAKTGFRP
jgi:molybdate transport system substrate-binding protein